MHKSILNKLDRVHRASISRGRKLGNMLGTAFYRDNDITYKMYDPPQDKAF